MMKHLLAVFILVFSAYLPGVYAEVMQPVKTLEGISEYRLDNGLTVILAPNPSVKTVYLNLVYQVGSLADPEGQSGTAHLLEHLMFKGTEQRTAQQFIKGLRQRSISFNANTSFNRTRYLAVFDADPTKLDYMLALEAERMQSLRFAQAALDSELEVVQREIDTARANTVSVLAQQMLAKTANGEGYARHVLGTSEELHRISIATLQEFYQRYYRPDNAVLVLTGGFDSEQALVAVQRYFSNIQSVDSVAKPVKTNRVTTHKPAMVEMTKGSMNMVALSYPIPAAADSRNLPLSTLADIFAGEPHGRLYQSLVVPGTVQAVFAIQEALKDGGHYLFGAILAAGQSRESAMQGMIAQLEGITGQPITLEELQRAKAGAQHIKAQMFSDPAALAEVLSESVAVGHWQLQLKRFDQVADLDLKSVRKQSQALLVKGKRITGHLHADTDAVTLNPAPREHTAKPVLQDKTETETPVAMPDVAVFNAQIMDIENSIQRGTLSNGMKVALRPLAGSSLPVQGVITLRFGDLQNLQGQRAVADLTGVLLVRGSKKLSYQHIVDRANRLGAGFVMQPNGAALTVRFTSPKENLPKLLQLLAEVLQQPAFSRKEFDLLKRQRLQELQMPVDSSKQLANLELRRYSESYAEGDIRQLIEQKDMLDAVAAVTRKDIQQFYQEFYGTQDGELILSGDFDAARTQVLLDDLFGNWTSTAAYHRLHRTHHATAPVRRHVESVGKHNGYYLSRLSFPVNGQSEDAAALYVIENIFGRHPLASRLGQRLREQEQLTYSIRSSIRIPTTGNASWITIEADHPVALGDRVADIVKEEIAKLAESGLSQYELDLAKSTLLNQRIQNLDRPQNIANMLTGQLREDITMESWVERNNAFADLTLEQVNAVARKYLKAEEWVEVVVGQHAEQSL